MPVKNRKLFYADHALTPHEKITESAILCDNDRIIAVGGASGFMQEPGLEIVHPENAFAMPGLIDCHVHGAGGFDSCNACDYPVEGLNMMSIALARHGVTTFFPTIMTAPKDRMIKNVAALAKMIAEPHDGAIPAGINVEGPFISPMKAGTHDRRSIIDIDLGFAKELFEAGNYKVKLMTFAPELPHSDKLIELMMEYGVIPSMGHSMADGESTQKAIIAGARHCTHLFNGMPPISQRSCDLTIEALTNNLVCVELIVDGGHLHPLMVDLASRVKPRDKIIGISNAIDLSSQTGGKITQEETSGVVMQNGLIAGTTTTLEKGWLHLIHYAKLPETLAAACFTSNPARELGLITRGELKPGRNADITFFDCETNTVRMTVVRGKIVYQAEN